MTARHTVIPQQDFHCFLCKFVCVAAPEFGHQSLALEHHTRVYNVVEEAPNLPSFCITPRFIHLFIINALNVKLINKIKLPFLGISLTKPKNGYKALEPASRTPVEKCTSVDELIELPERTADGALYAFVTGTVGIDHKSLADNEASPDIVKLALIK